MEILRQLVNRARFTIQFKHKIFGWKHFDHQETHIIQVHFNLNIRSKECYIFLLILPQRPIGSKLA